MAPLWWLLPFALTACSSDQPDIPSIAEGDEHIACAVDGAAELSQACAVERVRENDSLLLVVRHPDGAFRRFQVLSDGSGVAAADGADEGRVVLADGALDVTIGDDRYVFPATVRRAGAASGAADVP